MGIDTQIYRIKNAVKSSYNVVNSMSGTLPETQSIDNLPDAIRSIPQSSYTAGDGINIDDGSISVVTPVRDVLTKDEYNALSEEEKNKGLYLIPDGNSGSGSGGQSSGEVYSTEETRIGTWIDGKPIYRKSCSFIAPFVSGNVSSVIDSNIFSLPNIDTLINIEGTFYNNGNDTRSMCEFFGDNLEECIYGFRVYSDGSVYYYNYNRNSDRRVWLSAIYTKTTD